MKTFDEITRKFFASDELVEDDVTSLIPECWKPKTYFQSYFLHYALDSNKTNNKGNYSADLMNALSQYLDDFAGQHAITKNKILFDGNLNFTVSGTTATSASFQLTNGFIMGASIVVDGENIPPLSSTGMSAALNASNLKACYVTLSNVNANTFTDGEHHVVISIETLGSDLGPKTYKELVFENVDGETHPIVANKILPKTPEELAFALLIGIPVEFSSDLSEKPEGISGNDGDSK